MVNTFLSWGFFVPLARMTYMAYLVHNDLISMVVFSMTYAVEINDLVMSYFWAPFIMMSYAIAFVGGLMVEAPFISLEKILISKIMGGGRKRQSLEQLVEKTQDVNLDDIIKQKEMEIEKVIESTSRTSHGEVELEESNNMGIPHELPLEDGITGNRNRDQK